MEKCALTRKIENNEDKARMTPSCPSCEMMGACAVCNLAVNWLPKLAKRNDETDKYREFMVTPVGMMKMTDGVDSKVHRSLI